MDGYKRLELSAKEGTIINEGKEKLVTGDIFIKYVVDQIRKEASKGDAYFVKPNNINPTRKVLTPTLYDAQGNETQPAQLSEDYYATIIVRDEEQMNAAIAAAQSVGASATEV